MGVILAVLSSVLLAAGNVLLKKSYKDFSPSVSFFIFSVFSIFVWAPVGLLGGVNFDLWILGLVVGIASSIFGQAIYIYVLEKGELSITATILSTFSIYTIIFSVLFNKERPSPLTILFILITILGTIIVSWPEKINKKELSKISLIIWAIFAAVCIGASDTVAKNYIDKTSSGSFLFFVSCAQLVISFIYLKLDKKPLNQFREIASKFSDYKFALLGSTFISISTMFLFASFNFTLASIASPIVASSPVITVALALIFLKDKVSAKNWIGLSLVLIAVIAIGFINH